jgi:hypothetical protein
MPQASGPGGGSLQATLTVASDRGAIGNTVPAVTGTIEGLGQSNDAAINVVIASPTALFGTQTSSNTLRGQINGEVRLESGQGALTCRAPVWTLGPR